MEYALNLCVIEHKFMQPKISYDCVQTIATFIYHRDRFLFVVVFIELFFFFFFGSPLNSADVYQNLLQTLNKVHGYRYVL